MRLPAKVVSALLVGGAIAIALAQKSPEAPPVYAERGPAVGDPLPPFESADQEGRLRNFESLKGPRGLVLVFFQSADW